MAKGQGNISTEERKRRQSVEGKASTENLNGEVERYKCEICKKEKTPNMFYSTYTHSKKHKQFEDIGRFITVCKDCLNKMAKDNGGKYTLDSIRKSCMWLDIPCREDVILDGIRDGNFNLGNYYKKFFIKNYCEYDYESWENKRKNEETQVIHTEENGFEEDEECNFIVTRDIRQFWGNGFEKEGYEYLEAEISSWKTTHKCDNRAEQTLLKEICIKLWDIRKKRESGDNNVSKEQKELQDLMKTASVDPAKANVASAGKSQDAFGVWIKDIEEKRPAEWFEEQEKYKDMDGFLPYIKNYIVRPIENFMAGVRNFFVDDNIDVDLDSVDVGDKNE